MNEVTKARYNIIPPSTHQECSKAEEKERTRKGQTETDGEKW